MNVEVTDERIVKSVSVAINEDAVLSGSMTFRNGALSEGELNVRGESIGFIPLNFRCDKGVISLSPTRMSASLMGEVYSAIVAIQDTFSSEIAKAREIADNQ